MLHTVRAADVDEYTARAQEWASSVWDSWADQHEQIRAAVAEIWAAGLSPRNPSTGTRGRIP